MPRSRIPLDKIQQTIRSYWSVAELKTARRERQSTPRTVKDFLQDHPAEHRECFRRYTSFREVLKGMEPPYSNAYLYLTRRKTKATINPVKLGQRLYEWACKGNPIAPTYLRGCPKGSAERLAANSLKTLAGSSMFPISTVLEVESKITGLSTHDIQTTIVDRKKNSVIAENLVRLLLQYAPIVGVETGISGTPTWAEEQIRFWYDGNLGKTDIRMLDDTPINLDLPVEVKSYTGEFPRRDLDSLLKRYASEDREWETGDPMADCLAIFHQPELTYAQYKTEIEESGIQIMPHSQFYGLLEQTVNRLKQQPELVANLPPTSPRANLDYLLRLDKEIAGSYLLLRETNAHRRRWTLDMLKAINKRAKQIREGKVNPKEQEPEPKLKIPGAKTIRHKGGRFLMSQKGFGEIDSGSIGQYIRDHHSNLTLTSLQQRFPQLEGIAKQSLLFFDLETCGLAYTDPLISIGYSRFREGRVLESTVLFARDYSEERPMIDYFLKIMQDHDRILTYNGTSFDFPRLSERAKQNGIRLGNEMFTPLQESLGERHIDLLHLVKQRFPDLAGRKLGTLEKTLFNPPFKRKLDIPSRRVPEVYRDYVHPERRGKWVYVPFAGEDGEEKTQRQWEFTETTEKFKQRALRTREQNGEKLIHIIEHNRLDTITLPAVLAKLGEAA